LYSYSVPKFVLEGTPACSTVDPELFFPQEDQGSLVAKYVNLSKAKAICSTCPLKNPCLEYALRNMEIGVWGGTTENQREELRRVNKIRVTRKTPTPNIW
jgi:WhiB family redox-sensing transcriptional regulator